MIRIVPYSDLSIVLIGETFSIKDKIKALGGTFNKSLSIENNKVPGWVFPKTKETDVEELVKTVNNNKSSTTTSSNSSKTVQQNDIKGPISIDPKITHEMFANLLNKYEMLEARVNYLEKQSLKSNNRPTTASSSKYTRKSKPDSESEESDNETETIIQPDRFLED